MSRTVLLVDDDPNILDTAVDILEDAGLGVKAAANAAEALEVLRTEAIALVIADFNLPDLTGVQLSLKIHEMYPNVKIILMTGQQHLDTTGLRDVVQKVLLKPVDPHEILTLIKKTLDH